MSNNGGIPYTAIKGQANKICSKGYSLVSIIILPIPFIIIIIFCNHRVWKGGGDYHEPVARYGHSTAVVGDKMYLWAGTQEKLPGVHESSEKLKMTSFIEVFSLETGLWDCLPTSGTPPLGVQGYSCDSLKNDIYYFGGYCGHHWCRHNTIHSLVVGPMLHWRKISVVNPLDGPIQKSGCGMVAFCSEDEDCLFIFGGNGLLKDSSIHEGPARYFRLMTGEQALGCTNECHLLLIQSGNAYCTVLAMSFKSAVIVIPHAVISSVYTQHDLMHLSW